MSSCFRPLPWCAAAVLALAASGAWAQEGRGAGHDRGRGGDDQVAMREQAPIMRPVIESRARRGRRDDALADSVRRIERATRGQVISAERMQSDGRDINRIKVMDERGRIRVYMDDPQQRRAPRTRGDDN